LKSVAQASYNGRQTRPSRAAGYVGEYNARCRLVKLGYTDSLDSLDGFTADCFMIISETFDKEASRKRK